MAAPANKLPVKSRMTDEKRLRAMKHYLLLREAGMLFYEACKSAGLEPSVVTGYRSRHPDFAEAEAQARSAGVEIIEQRLRDKAVEGDYQSIKTFLEANDDRYGKNSHTERSTVVIISADNAIERVQNLREELIRRQRDIPDRVLGINPFFSRQPADIVEAEIVDE